MSSERQIRRIVIKATDRAGLELELIEYASGAFGISQAGAPMSDFQYPQEQLEKCVEHFANLVDNCAEQ